MECFYSAKSIGELSSIDSMDEWVRIEKAHPNNCYEIVLKNWHFNIEFETLRVWDLWLPFLY